MAGLSDRLTAAACCGSRLLKALVRRGRTVGRNDGGPRTTSSTIPWVLQIAGRFDQYQQKYLMRVCRKVMQMSGRYIMTLSDRAVLRRRLWAVANPARWGRYLVTANLLWICGEHRCLAAQPRGDRDQYLD